MARYYCVNVLPNLFGDISVLRTWGRIGTHGRTSVETYATAGEAETAAVRTVRRKVRRGYTPAVQLNKEILAPWDRVLPG